MSEEIITYADIDHVGMELFRKNNETFYKSSLSHIMAKIFVAANKDNGITEIKDEYYMKSGSIPNKRVYYIYSDQLAESDKYKIYDIVYFNNKECIWFYIKNAINMIGENPVKYTKEIYRILLRALMPSSSVSIVTQDFGEIEKYYILLNVMAIRLIYFIYDTYGVIDLEAVKEEFCKNCNLNEKYTSDSIMKFIEDTIDNFNNKQYFFDRIYLDSYMLLEEK